MRFIQNQQSILQIIREDGCLFPFIAYREDDGLISHTYGSLRIFIKPAHPIDFIIKELYAQRMFLIYRENIDNIPANGEMSTSFDLIHPFIAHAGKSSQEVFPFYTVFFCQGYALRKESLLLRKLLCRFH